MDWLAGGRAHAHWHHPPVATADPTATPTAPAAGKATVNSMYGTRVAVLAGDFLFAQSSWFLANLDNMEVCVCGG